MSFSKESEELSFVHDHLQSKSNAHIFIIAKVMADKIAEKLKKIETDIRKTLNSPP